MTMTMSDERSRASVDLSLEGAEIGAVERKSALAHKASPGYHAYRVPNPPRSQTRYLQCEIVCVSAIGISNSAGQ